jgi:lysophospholipase L1-like esterase
MHEFFYIIFYIILITMLFFIRPAVKRYKETDFLYTALGDDISKSLTAFLSYGFVYRVKRYLKTRNPNFVYNNFAKPSFTGSDLLDQLKNSFEVRQCLKKSAIITLSIGGNNLLKGVFENFTEIDGRVAGRGVEEFKEAWPEILHFIRNHIASKASIYVMTLYNPYSYENPNYTIAEYYINSLNSIIKSEFWTRIFNYKVVDVHDNFEGNLLRKFAFFYGFIKEPLPSYRTYKHIGEAFISTMDSK